MGGLRPIEPLYEHWKGVSQSEYTDIILDFKKYCSEATIIIDKNGKAVPFILNEVQIIIAETLLPLMFQEMPQPITVVIHKARQEGVSVLLARLEHYVATRRKNLSIMHLLPTDDLASKFYEQKCRALIEGCVLGNAEVLTMDGWVKFDDYDGRPILVSDSNKSWFEKPKEVVQFDNSEGLVEYSGKSYYHLSTKGHRMVFKRNGKTVIREAWEGIPKDSSSNVFVTTEKFEGEGIDESDDLIRLAVAIQADGHYASKYGIVFQFAKERKIKRLKEILDNLGIEYTQTILNGINKGQVKIRISTKYKLPNYKIFPIHWLYTMSMRQKLLFLNEIGHWDGVIEKHRNSTEYYSSDKECATFVDTLARLSGIHSKMSIKKTVGNRKTAYRVKIPWDRSYVTTQQANRRDIEYSGKVHCVTVSSGMFWVRMNDQMSVTGNTHPTFLPEIVASTSQNIFIKVRSWAGKTINSYIKIGGALSKGSGRSSTNQVVIFDEYAYYERVSQLEKGILATQPKTGFALTVYVSTANGVNHFYDVVRLAKKETSKMIYLFLPWHLLKEYEAEPEGRLKELTSLTEYELFLCNIFKEAGYPINVWTRKLQFWNNTFELEAKGDMEFMKSEYPSTPDESFLASGNPALPSAVIMDMLKRAEEVRFDYVEPILGDTQDRYGRRVQNKVSFSKVHISPVKMYKPPEAGKRYILAVDPSEGGINGDYSAGFVLDDEKLEEVCTFYVKMEHEDLAELTINIAKHYNNAIIVPERNMGLTLIEFIRLGGYSRLYVDPLSTRQRTMFGIRMTKQTKDEAIRRFRFLLNNGLYHTPDTGFLDDALHYVRKETPGGFYKYEASGTHEDSNEPYHDDTVAARLTLMAMMDMRRFRDYANYKNNTDRNMR